MAGKGSLKALGDELRARREACGFSQEKLADLAGLHRNFIGLIERGQRNPTYLTLVAVSSRLSVSLAELVSAAERRVR